MTAASDAPADLAALEAAWMQAWPQALALWSRFARLQAPIFCRDAAAAEREGLAGGFAMIRLTDHRVVVNLAAVCALRLGDLAAEILAHEIGHHVYCPADLTDHGRMLARMRAALPTKEERAPLVANLYADLLINDRLQRSRGLALAAVYGRLVGGDDPLWTLYTRMYEILWSLPRGTLSRGSPTDRLEGDARLGARLVRSYASDWLAGAGRFAALCLPYVLDQESETLARVLTALDDLSAAGRGGAVTGLTGIEADERDGAIHPAFDPALSGLAPAAEPPPSVPPEETTWDESPGQYRQPFQYGQLLRALGLDLDDHEVAARYYRERALPHLIPFPGQALPQAVEPLPEGTGRWEIGAPLEDVDWLESVLVSPRVVPGLTTVQRVYGVTEGAERRWEPLDLDLYVDCSGSMPDPQRLMSYLALAGTIIALSALRAGGRVQATLWSGAGQFETTGGFTTDERRVLQVITGYLGGGTAFPIHILRDTYAGRRATDRAVHILVISDDGVTTMFDADERGGSGWAISRQALAAARGGGTLALRLPVRRRPVDLQRAVEEGWVIAPLATWDDLVAFARSFSGDHFARKLP